MSRLTSRIALVGADNLLGREIKEALERSVKNIEIESFASNGEANFGEEEGEAVYRQAVSADTLRPVQAVVLAGSAAGTQKALAAVGALETPPLLIECTGVLDQEANASIVSPQLDKELPLQPVLTVAHPAATVLAVLLSKLARYAAVARAVFEIFEPASEQGKVGIAELQQQTTSLLSFKPLEKKTYDAQLSFAMLPAYGEDASVSLVSIEQRIERHLATLLADLLHSGVAIPMPSLRLIQAPVFHGYTFSGWIEFERLANAAEIEAALESEETDVRKVGQEPPTNIGVAGQSGIVIGDIRTDRNNPRAVWLWAVADNLRTIAEAVSAIVSQKPVSSK